MLANDGCSRVNCTDDTGRRETCVSALCHGAIPIDGSSRWQEESETLNSNIVQEENEGYTNSGRAENAAHNLGLVDLVQNGSGADILGLHSSNRQYWIRTETLV